MRFFICILVLGLMGCSSTSVPDSSSEEIRRKETSSQRDYDPEDAYYFQHRLLPDFAYNSDGKFYQDLKSLDTTILRDIATDVVSASYAEAITVKAIDNRSAILIEFPNPVKPPNCYFIIVRKIDESYAFYTYEKAMRFGADDVVIGVVGAWYEDGSRANLGPRTYETAEEFANDILGSDG